MARRFETIEHLAWRGLWLRRWCFTCDRGSSINATKALAIRSEARMIQREYRQ